MKQDNWLATERIKFYHNLFVQWIFNGFYLHFQNTEIMIQNDVFSSQILHGRNSNFVKETKKKIYSQTINQNTRVQAGMFMVAHLQESACIFVVSKFGPFFRETSVI